MTDTYRMCSLPDSLTTEEISAKWPKRLLRPCITGQLPGLTFEQWQAALTEAWGYWTAVADLVVEFTDQARMADILHGVGVIDGRGKTLAWSELPNGTNTRLQQKYDSGEDWVREIDPVAVACHEIGHALGLGHDNAGGAALMDPYYSPKIRKPQPRDIQRIQQLYGPPRANPAVPVPVPAGIDPTLERVLAVLSEATLNGWKVLRL